MALQCPACHAELVESSRFCHRCGVQLAPTRPSMVQTVTVVCARLLIPLTLIVNIVGWMACFKSIGTAILLGLLDGLLGLLLVIVGLVGRYRWAWSLGLAHFGLPWVMYALVWSARMGPLRAKPAFLWADALFLAAVAPLSIIAWHRGSAIGRPKAPGFCQACGYVLHGLTEPRCPECGTPFDPRLLVQAGLRADTSAPERR